jgi:hypothetical protein
MDGQDQQITVAETHFVERVAARYETYWPELFKPAAIDLVVNDLADLADLAGDGGALELGVGIGRPAQPPRCTRRQDRAVLCHGGALQAPARRR